MTSVVGRAAAMSAFEAGSSPMYSFPSAAILNASDSPTVSRFWSSPLAFLFIDGGHGTEPAHRDYEQWTPLVAPGGTLCIHDVFPDPADGGRPPYDVYCRALASGDFAEVEELGSMRVLRRVGGDAGDPVS